MTQDAVQAVRDFVAHIDAQSRARREAGPKFEHTPDEKARREVLMQNLLVALGMTRLELQYQLRIDRATWDRWRAISSVPHRSHLDALARYAEERVSNEGESAKLPPPLEMLNASPRTWGRLRLVYCMFPWKNAVLGFKEPYWDNETANEMALLSLRGCQIIYILPHAEEWSRKFSNSLVEVLGKNYAALALSRICIIEIPETIADELPPFGLFNYETTNPTDCVGYIWKNVKSLDKRPSDKDGDEYEAFSATDDRYTAVGAKYWTLIQDAFNEIHKRVPKPEDFWSPIRDAKVRDGLLVIPIVPYKEQEQNPT